MLYGIKVDMIK